MPQDNRMHGSDERIRIRDFYEGPELFDQFVKMLVGAPRRDQT
jgi:acetylornithine deacetylase/succinyl-diaminopimelate desuccinylase-like protein